MKVLATPSKPSARTKETLGLSPVLEFLIINFLKIKNMVTVKDIAIRQAKDGREFIALILQGGLSLVQSRLTGNTYATVKQCSITSTFDEETAKGFIGEKLPGSVQRMSCDPYEWVNKETGEVIELSHRWVYVPEGATLEEAIFEGEPEVALADKKSSLKLQPTL